MGMDRADHIIFGWKIPREMPGVNFRDEKFLPVIEGHPGEKFALVDDGEAGRDYRVFGYRVGYESSDNGWALTELDIPNLQTPVVMADLHLRWNDLFETINEEPPKLYILSSWH